MLITTRSIWSLVLVTIALVAMANVPRLASATSGSFTGSHFGFLIRWSGEWNETTPWFKYDETVVDASALQWSAGLSVSHVGFLTNATTPYNIARDFLSTFVPNHDQGTTIQTARVDANGDLLGTYMEFDALTLAIFPYSLPVQGSAFVEAWWFPSSIAQSTLDLAYQKLYVRLPATEKEQGVLPENETNSQQAPQMTPTQQAAISASSTVNPTAALADCAGFQAWSESIEDIYLRLQATVESLSEGLRLPGLWREAAINLALGNLGKLNDELLSMDDPSYSATAVFHLSSALSHYYSAVGLINSYAAPDRVEVELQLATSNADSFLVEFSRLIAACR